MFLLDTSLSEYMRVYGEEEKCLEEIYHCKWPHGFICPYCSHNDGYRLSRLRMMEFSSCGRQSSITASTIFQDSKIPLTKWFLAIYLVAHDKGGVSAMRLEQELGVQSKSAAKLLSKPRIAMGDRDENLTLAGYIELDEAFLGGRRKTRSAGKSPFEGKICVLVMVESENMQAGNLVLKAIPDRKIGTLREVVEQRIESAPGRSGN